MDIIGLDNIAPLGCCKSGGAVLQERSFFLSRIQTQNFSRRMSPT